MPKIESTQLQIIIANHLSKSKSDGNVTDCCDDGGGEEDALDVGPLVADLLRRDVHPLLGGHGDRFFVAQQCVVNFRDHLVLIIEKGVANFKQLTRSIIIFFQIEYLTKA